MMKLAVMCIYDARAETYFTPYFQSSVAQAERAFGDEVNRPAEDNILYKHPDDFELMHLGWFDTSDGTFELAESRVAHARSLVRAVPGDTRQLALKGVQ